jgi:hypothetical protein
MPEMAVDPGAEGVLFDGLPQQRDGLIQPAAILRELARTQEHLGTSDRAIISMRRMLIKAARDLANGIEPQATDPSMPYQTIRSAERNIALDADWRELGTEKDPMWQAIEPLVTTAQAG